jgi:hypothetical protein
MSPLDHRQLLTRPVAPLDAGAGSTTQDTP